MCQCTRMIEVKNDPGEIIKFEFIYNTGAPDKPLKEDKIINLSRKFKKTPFDPESDDYYIYEEIPEEE